MQITDNPLPKQLDTLIINANIATFSEDFGYCPNTDSHNEYGTLTNSAIGIKDGKIVWIGDSQVAEKYNNKDTQVTDIQGKWITSGLIDCHTHLVYAGNRSNEFEARLNGASYTDIAQSGGGILSTVKATREADDEELYRQSEKRLKALINEGVTSIEIKSGYGLDFKSEEKMLRVAKKLGEDYGITVKKTYLAAHALPPEYRDENGDNADAYIDKVCEWLPILHQQGLVDAVDGFIEEIAFDLAQITKVFDTAKALGIPVKLHSEQLTDMGGSELVAKYQGLSSDHLEQLGENAIKQMADGDTVAVLLPGAFYTLRDETVPPIDLLRKHQVDMAVSTDCNPGTSPVTSLLLMMNMACTLFDLTPEEALAGVTRNAAKALGLTNKGQIAIGKDADLVVWDIERPADLSYLVGLNPLEKVMIGGQWRG